MRLRGLPLRTGRSSTLVADKRRRAVSVKWPKSKWIREITGRDAGSSGHLIQDPWGTVDFTPSLAPLQGIQETVSENHGRHWRDSGGDVGGDFTSTKRYMEPVSQTVFTIKSPVYLDGGIGNSSEYKYTYKGVLYPQMPTSYPPFASSSDSSLAAKGTIAIANCAPTNPVANLATAVLEAYREGLPHLVGHTLWADRTLNAQRLLHNPDVVKDQAGRVVKDKSGEFLNYQFGWLPLLADITQFLNGVVNLEKLVNQYLRDAGKVVRRNYRFPLSTTVNETVLGVPGSVSIAGPGDFTGAMMSAVRKGTATRRRITTVDCWFSGAFTYHLPNDMFVGLAGGDKLFIARKMLGLDLNPDVLWELAPWSWAVDWFSNVGKVIHNLTSFQTDGLVLKYGYIMEHTTVRDVYDFSGDLGLRAGIEFSGRPPAIILVSETKLRRRATPFGFGLNLSALTSRQKAIMAALGLSRLK